ANLLDRLAYEPGRNAKLRQMTDFFHTVPDPERGFALAALTGSLSFQHAKPGLIRTLIMERVDPVLFGWSYDYVGDLAETVALIWPGLVPPCLELFSWVEGRAEKPLAVNPVSFRPAMLAHAVEEADLAALNPHDFAAEWKWDGIRVQAVATHRDDGGRAARL